jgi:hypothetical protein
MLIFSGEIFWTIFRVLSSDLPTATTKWSQTGKTEVIASTIGKSSFSAFRINVKPQTFIKKE